MKKMLNWSSLPIFIIFIVFTILNAIITKGFFTLSFFNAFIQSSTPLVILAIGEAVVLLGGGIDISLGAILSLSGVVFAFLSSLGMSIVLILAIVILCGLAMGCIEWIIYCSESLSWQEYRNNKDAKVNWQFTTEDARIKLERLYLTNGD